MSSHPAHNELQPTGTTLPLELELEEDIDKEINHFVQLSRMGHYAEAQRFFDNTLGKHDYIFPVVAEYADMLLEQGCYRRAVELLNEHIRAKAEFLDPDEMQLLKIMKALAEIYSKGALRSALVEAKRAWSHLDLEGKQRLGDLNEVQIHIYEMYVNITVFGFRTSQWVDEGWMHCPLPWSTTHSKNGFVQWFCILKEGGLLWEASRIMRALLPIMPSLLAGDLRELLDNSWIDGRSVELSVVERWAALMMVLHQAHFLLNAALLVGVLGDNGRAANQFYTMGWARLEIAEQNWHHKSGSSNLHLALAKVSFETARFCLSSRSADPDLLFALSNLLSEADRHNDLRNQTLVRLYILLNNDAAAMDWRDLYSILELQAADCGNVVEYVHIWDLFATWTLNSELLFRHLPRNLPLEADRPTLLLSQHTSRACSGQKWRNLIRKRSPFWEPLSFLGQSYSGGLTFDPSRHDYPWRFDIPLYSFLPDAFHQLPLRFSRKEYEASMHVVRALTRHLNDTKIIFLDEDDHNQGLQLKQSAIKLQPNIRPRLSEKLAADREATSAADKGRHNAASLAVPNLGDKHEQPLLSVSSDKSSTDHPISSDTSKPSAASSTVSKSPRSKMGLKSDNPKPPGDMLSLTDSVPRHSIEDERRYQRYLDGAYVFPNDEQELNRLDMQHNMFKLVNNGRLYFAPLQDPKEMLDIGTGSGIWPIEMAALFPNAEIIGTDLSPIQPTVVPKNVRFLIDDAAEDDWRWDPDHFDYIRLAHLTGAMPSFKELLRKSLHHLKPGGWLECHEMDPKPMCDDGTMPPENEEGGRSAFALHDWWRAQHRSGQLINPPRQFRVAHRIERSMRESGFVDIQQRIKRVPTNPWPSDPEMKEIGSRSERNWLEALSGWSYTPLASLGWTRAEIEVFLVDVRKAIRNRDVHCYMNFHVVTGRKPFPDEKKAS